MNTGMHSSLGAIHAIAFMRSLAWLSKPFMQPPNARFMGKHI